MKKYLITMILVIMACLGAKAQSYALVDMEYIMKNIPAYQSANAELEKVSKKYQAEIDALQKQSEDMYKAYQTNVSKLSAPAKKSQEDAIVAKDKEVYDLRMKYFGPEGEMAKLRKKYLDGVQNKVWDALKTLAKNNGLALIFDRSTSKIVYADPGMDISNSVLQSLGINK